MPFSFGTPVASLPNKSYREVAIRVERIRSGLFYIHSQWEKPQLKTSSEDLSFNDGSLIAGSEQTDAIPSCTPVDSTISQQFSFGQTRMNSASSSLRKNEHRPDRAVPLRGVTATSNFNFNAVVKFGKSGSNTTLPQNFAFQSVVDSISSTQENCANGTADTVYETNQQVVYVSDFVIDGQSYTLKASFIRSNAKIVGSLELTEVETKSIDATEETFKDGEKDESNPSSSKVEENLNQQQRPSAVWANFNGGMTKILKKSLDSDHRQWRSEDFDGRFAYSERLFSVDEWKQWKSLTCLLWIEFETFSDGEKRVLKQLADMYIQQNHCDVQFTFKGDLGTRQHVGGHVNILVARSSVFAAMFEHDMKEAATGEVEIEDVQPDIFKQLLHYIYSGRLSTPLTETTAQPLFVAADKYDINDLKEECVFFLLTCVRVDNAISLFVWAHLHSVDELHQVTLSFMTLHGKEVCHLKEWEDLTKNYPELCMLATRRIIDRMSI